MPQDSIPSETVIELNGPVLMFTLCVAVGTALIFGLAPVAESSRHAMNDALRDSGKGVTGGFQGKWLRDAVVIGEVALSLTLLMGAGLLMRSFVRLRQVNLGFAADHVFQTAVVLPEERYKTVEQVSAFYRPLLERLKSLPGVVDTAVSSSLPPFNFTESKIEIAGKSHGEDWHSLLQNVSAEYFRALGIDLKQGRGFKEAEVDGARRLAVVNQTFVRKYLGNQNPIGQHLRLANLQGVTDPSFEIIGVAADVTNRGLQAPIEPELWVPYTITTPRQQVLIVRTAQDPGTIQDLVQKEVWATDSGVALAFPGALDDSVSKYLYAGPRFAFVVMTIFGCVGLILVTGGVYSVLAYSTARKTHEIGIRMALGAESADVLSLVVGTGLRLVLAGVAIGVLISLTLGRFFGTSLVGVRVCDPATLVTTTLLLAATAAVACWIPARRAARVDPMVALRYE
jgi:putative ABC transport system permease protein